MDNLPLELKKCILDCLGYQYDLMLNRYHRWDKKCFYIVLSIQCDFISGSYLENIEFRITGTRKGYTLEYIQKGIHLVGTELNFIKLNTLFKSICVDIVKKFRYFNELYCISDTVISSQGFYIRIPILKHFDLQEYSLMKLLKLKKF